MSGKASCIASRGASSTSRPWPWPCRDRRAATERRGIGDLGDDAGECASDPLTVGLAQRDQPDAGRDEVGGRRRGDRPSASAAAAMPCRAAGDADRHRIGGSSPRRERTAAGQVDSVDAARRRRPAASSPAAARRVAGNAAASSRSPPAGRDRRRPRSAWHSSTASDQPAPLRSMSASQVSQAWPIANQPCLHRPFEAVAEAEGADGIAWREPLQQALQASAQ